MKGMEKISEAILSKVRVEAQNIIKDAEGEAREELAQAKRQRQTKLDEEKCKMIESAEREAAQILAQASIKAREEVLRAKASIIDEIFHGARNALSGISSDESALLNLTRETINGLGTNRVRIYVSPRDLSVAKTIVKSDGELANKVIEIKEYECLGGVIAEDIDAKVRIDNTYETRLEMLLPRLLPEITKELF